ncbi:MAG TPA: hypothetical protein VFZ17_00140 [Acidimicrobiia bacterium]|nr:hypothetical protein [Acidimicrobiia bacterium]
MRRSSFAAMAMLLVVGLSAVTQVAAAAPATAAATPREWDARLLPIVEQVQKLRGLTFEHPVKVEYLADAAFEKRVAIDDEKLSKADKRGAERSEAQLRALGLVPPGTDLLASTSDLQQSGVLAYYSPVTKQVTVRGKKLDVPIRVTLAHELTHALQDQHFDLTEIQRAARKDHGSAAATALIEGDATRVQREYVDGLSGAEREEYSQWERDTGTQVDGELDADAVPGVLIAIFQSPYVLGPEMLRAVVAAKGDGAVDDLFRDPPADDLSYLDPLSIVGDHAGAKVTPPTLDAGDEQDGKRDVFGAFALYLLLATSGDPVHALDVARGWGDDAMVTFTRSGTTCLRATFTGTNGETSSAIHDALADWATNRSGGAASVTAASDDTTLTACDRGGATTDPGTTPQAALVTAAIRSTLLAQALEVFGERTASCVVDRALSDPTFRPLLDASVATPYAAPDESVSDAFTRRITAIATSCADA